MTDLKNALYGELVARFGVDAGLLNDDTELFSSGLVDSLSVLDLVCFVEGQLGALISPLDITLENFDSVSRIVTYTKRLFSATGGP